jgi:hypothetical protein
MFSSIKNTESLNGFFILFVGVPHPTVYRQHSGNRLVGKGRAGRSSVELSTSSFATRARLTS